MSLAITKNLNRLLSFQRAQSVAFYMSTSEEVDTCYAIDLAANQGKDIYLPVINSSGFRKSPLLFEPFDPDQTTLKENRYGILEPVHVSGGGRLGKELDLVCVPLVGFNSNCDRIGMGAGFYDRAFSTFSQKRWQKVNLVGLAFSCQQAEFTAAAHDVPMHAIVTETGTFYSK